MNANINYKKAVSAIKEAILRSQYKAVSSVNREQLSLYYGIGHYVSQNSRDGFWGTGAIEQISTMLQKELPGLRGFSVTNMKNMRVFYEEWSMILNRQPVAGDLYVTETKTILNRQPVADDLQTTENVNRQPVADDLQTTENVNRQPVADDLQTTENVNRQPAADDLETTENVNRQPAADDLQTTENVNRQPAADDLEITENVNRQPVADDLQMTENEMHVNRQPMADDLQTIENVNRQPLAGDLAVNEKLLLLAICPSATDDLTVDEKLLLLTIRPTAAGEFNWADFLSIGFSHHIEIISKAKSFDARLFYIHECATRFWSKYVLRDYLRGDLYGKRGSMPNNFSQTMPDVKQMLKAVAAFKDEYLLDYINVEQIDEAEKDLDERVLENGIVTNIKKFIMTVGQDFSFIGNQYKIEVAGEELFIDLLFFNRELNALVAIELKTGKFRASYLGQLNLYLSALDENLRKPHENASIGIILCKEMNHTFVQFAVRDYSKSMGVATYHTSEEMPENMRKALSGIDELKKLL
jgi:predicted nuclease of restriction endonuclease-like (RecB) superfamily